MPKNSLNDLSFSSRFAIFVVVTLLLLTPFIYGQLKDDDEVVRLDRFDEYAEYEVTATESAPSPEAEEELDAVEYDDAADGPDAWAARAEAAEREAEMEARMEALIMGDYAALDTLAARPQPAQTRTVAQTRAAPNDACALPDLPDTGWVPELVGATSSHMSKLEGCWEATVEGEGKRTKLQFVVHGDRLQALEIWPDRYKARAPGEVQAIAFDGTHLQLVRIDRNVALARLWDARMTGPDTFEGIEEIKDTTGIGFGGVRITSPLQLRRLPPDAAALQPPMTAEERMAQQYFERDAILQRCVDGDEQACDEFGRKFDDFMRSSNYALGVGAAEQQRLERSVDRRRGEHIRNFNDSAAQAEDLASDYRRMADQSRGSKADAYEAEAAKLESWAAGQRALARSLEAQR